MKHFYRHCLALLVLFSGFTLSAQVEEIQTSLPHEMTPEELLRKGEIGIRFVETPPPTGTIRNIAEFEQVEGALVRYPFGIPLALIAEISTDTKVWTVVTGASQQATVTNSYTSAGVNLSNCIWVYGPSDSYWTRDYGPWFIHYGNTESAIVDFPYNRPRPMDDSIPKVVAAQMGIPWFGMNIIHTGGNYMTTGRGISASTDLVVTENPSLTTTEMDSIAQLYLGVDTYYKVPDPNNTYIDHIDCWGKFLAPDKVLIRSVPTSHPQYQAIENTATYFSNLVSPYGNHFQVFRVYTPNNQPYTNSVILNNKVLVPIMNQIQYDTAAIHAYEVAMPGYEVLGFIGGSQAWQSTDALHCRVMGLADRGMLEILHDPTLGYQPYQGTYNFSAQITTYSGTGLYPDSVILYYKTGTSAYTPVVMTYAGNSVYEASIPGSWGTISYYIHAADSSGRSANHPYIGAPDPHIFWNSATSTEEPLNSGDVYGTLLKATPNPFSYACNFEFRLKEITPVTLEVYSLDGRRISTLVSQPLGAGLHFFAWDGHSSNGNKVAPGLYYARLTAGDISSGVKIIYKGN